MATSATAPITLPARNAVPEALLKVTFALFVINLTFFPAAYFTHAWIYDADGLGIPTDFVNVWAAGKLVLEGHPALAYDWDIQKQVELELLVGLLRANEVAEMGRVERAPEDPHRSKAGPRGRRVSRGRVRRPRRGT